MSFDYFHKAFGDFMNKITSMSSDAVILTSSEQYSRSRRQSIDASPSIKSCPNDTKEMTTVFGNQNGSCAAMFYQVYLQDKSNNSRNLNLLTVTSSYLECNDSFTV